MGDSRDDRRLNNLTAVYSSRNYQKLGAEEILPGQAVWSVHLSTDHGCWVTLLQLSWAGRRVWTSPLVFGLFGLGIRGKL
jgi:hypothetical protein